jgi:branched-chain amino acid transport system substrate-binding protein
MNCRFIGLALFLFPFFLYAADVLPKKPVVKIGVIIPLSGDNAFVGEDIRDGLLLARKITADHDRNYQLIFEDSRFDLHQAALEAQKLITVDHVDALVSLWDEADVIAPLAEKSKTLHFSIRWDPDVAIKNHYTFTHENTYYAYVASTLKLLEKLGARRVAALINKKQGWVLGAHEFQRLTATSPVKLVSTQTFIPGERDVRSIIAKAAEARPDAFFILASIPEMDIVLKQLRQMFPQTPVTGYFDYVQEEMKGIENQPYVAQAEGTEEFNRIFKKQYGSLPKTRAPHAFDIFNLFALAYSKFPINPKPTSDQLISELVKIQNYPGAVGTLNVDPRHFIESPSIWKMVKNGKRILINPEQVKPLSSH